MIIATGMTLLVAASSSRPPPRLGSSLGESLEDRASPQEYLSGRY